MAMRIIFQVAWKDIRLIFRDRSALTLMLLAPFVLTIGMGAITGRFSGSSTSSGVSDIPLVIVNDDSGQLGSALVEMLQSEDLDALLNPLVMTDLAAARAMVDNDNTAAAIYVPPDFTASIIPSSQLDAATQEKVVQIEFYANPTRTTSAGIVRTLLEQFLSQVEIGRISGEVTVTQLLANGYINPEQAVAVGSSIGQQMVQSSGSTSSIKLINVTEGGGPVEFDTLAYIAPGMALMFLMYTVTYGGLSLIKENRQGTLARMLISPTTSTQVLSGKVIGIFLTAVAQLLILIGGTSLLFGLKWGDPLAVLALLFAAAFAATGWGMVIAAFLKTPGQVGSIGSALMLIFGLLGGSFFDVSSLPGWVKTISKISPNAWGMEGFLDLAHGGSIVSVRTPVLALLIMGAILFCAAAFWISRRGLARK